MGRRNRRTQARPLFSYITLCRMSALPRTVWFSGTEPGGGNTRHAKRQRVRYAISLSPASPAPERGEARATKSLSFATSPPWRGKKRTEKKMNAVPHARERAPPRIDQASSPGNRSASSPRTMKQDVAALAAIVHARQRQPCIESKSVQHGLREQQSTRCELMSGASIDSTQRCHTRAKLCPLPTRDGALAVENRRCRGARGK